VHLQGSNRSNSSMGFGVVSTTIHCLAQGVGSRGTTCPQTRGELRSTSGFTAPREGQAPDAPRVHYASPCMQLCSYKCASVLCLLLCTHPSCGQLLFHYLASSPSCAILLQACLLEVPMTYLGSLEYFLSRGPVLLNGCSLEKLMLMKSSECTDCLA
jgi:hypothetical protein